jgi:hypothetical protein
VHRSCSLRPLKVRSEHIFSANIATHPGVASARHRLGAADSRRLTWSLPAGRGPGDSELHPLDIHHGFEDVAFVAQIAQLVEQGIENPRVGGSIPSLGTSFRLA